MKKILLFGLSFVIVGLYAKGGNKENCGRVFKVRHLSAQLVSKKVTDATLGIKGAKEGDKVELTSGASKDLQFRRGSDGVWVLMRKRR